jgi:hypothetical protein
VTFLAATAIATIESMETALLEGRWGPPEAGRRHGAAMIIDNGRRLVFCAALPFGLVYPMISLLETLPLSQML